MKSSTTPCTRLSPAIGKIMLGVVFASVLAGTSIAPAIGSDGDGGQKNGWHKDEQRNERKSQRHSERNFYRDRRDPYYYSAPVYAPRSIDYAPQPSPGIRLFFPLDSRR